MRVDYGARAASAMRSVRRRARAARAPALMPMSLCALSAVLMRRHAAAAKTAACAILPCRTRYIMRVRARALCARLREGMRRYEWLW